MLAPAPWLEDGAALGFACVTGNLIGLLRNRHSFAAIGSLWFESR
jgi:hypothetical protein